ncbi:hypothetical protein KAR91_27775, partial [Candidatus Pacearchaeota archaeon]|nr:hypothetical protein [Candidatus Pacearchaeota archaeon]
FREEYLSVSQIRGLTNSSSTTYVQDQLVKEQGYFGNVTDCDSDGIADGETFTLDFNPHRIIRTDQIKTADTFAESVNGQAANVYFNETTMLLEDAESASNVLVGKLAVGGAKDSNDLISFLPLQEGPVTITSSEIAEDVIQTINKTLTAAEVKTLFSANTNKGMEIVPAPAAGKVIEFVSAQLRYNYDDANAYTAANGLTFNIEAVPVSDLIAVTFLQGTADRYANVQALSAEIDQDLSAVTAKPLYLQEGTTNPTGSGVEADTIKIAVTYRVRDLAV